MVRTLCKISVRTFSGRRLQAQGERRTTNFGEQGLNIIVFERQPSTQHDIENYSTAPNVNLWAGVKPSSNHFWCSIIGTTTARLEEITILDLIGKPEVRYFDVEIVIKKHILWLEISVDDFELVAVLYP
jgi:hypothetical protein